MPSESREDGHSRIETNEQIRDRHQIDSLEETISASPPPGRVSSEENFVTTRQKAQGLNSILQAQGLPDAEASDASPFKAAALLPRTPTLALSPRPGIQSAPQLLSPKEKWGTSALPFSPGQTSIPTFFKSMRSPASTSLFSLPAQKTGAREAVEALAAVIKSGGVVGQSPSVLQGVTLKESNPNAQTATQPANPNPLSTAHDVLLETLQKKSSSDSTIELQICLLQSLIAQNKEQNALHKLIQEQQIQLQSQAHLLQQCMGTRSQPILLESSTPPEVTQLRKAALTKRTSSLQQPMRSATVANQQNASAGTHQSHLHDPGNCKQHNHAEQPHLNAQDEEIILAAQQRIAARQPHPADENKLTFKVKKPARKSDTNMLRQEKRLARLTADKEYLKHGSERCKNEALSEDEREELLAELETKQATHLLFNPKAPIPRTKHGYIRSEFVADDSESPEHFDGDSEEEEDNYEEDGDPSSDYLPSSTSQSRSLEQLSRPKNFSSAQWDEYQQLKRASTAPQPSQSLSANTQLTYNISVAEPPEHGEWRDIHHLTTTFRDKHDKYVRRCKGAGHLSVWDCYTITQKECILKHLEDADGKSGRTKRDAEYLESLSDSQLYALLQGALGIEYELEVEAALKAIPFTGKILDKSNWVSFHTSWSQVLKRVTSEGAVQPRRMAEIFRNSITDKFVKDWLMARKHHTWELAYDAIVSAIQNPKWLKCYVDDLAQHPKQHQQHQLAVTQHTSAKTPAQSHQQPAQLHQHPVVPKKHDKLDDEQQAKTFDPLAFKTKAGPNVNPNFQLTLNENQPNALCSRCGKLHRWLQDLCTALKNAQGENCAPLSPEAFKRRLQARWDKGYYFSKPLDAYKSPSPSDAAAAAAQTSHKLGAKP